MAKINFASGHVYESEAAISVYEAAKALEIEPESIYILDTYSWILFLQGDNFLSEFYFDKLLRVEKEQGQQPSIETLYHIGDVQYYVCIRKCTCRKVKHRLLKFVIRFNNSGCVLIDYLKIFSIYDTHDSMACCLCFRGDN